MGVKQNIMSCLQVSLELALFFDSKTLSVALAFSLIVLWAHFGWKTAICKVPAWDIICVNSVKVVVVCHILNIYFDISLFGLDCNKNILVMLAFKFVFKDVPMCWVVISHSDHFVYQHGLSIHIGIEYFKPCKAQVLRLYIFPCSAQMNMEFSC